MRRWLAGCAAIAMMAAGCGAGNTPNGKLAPAITSTPPATAQIGVPFNYTMTATGMTPIGFEVVSGPEGFEIHPGSGVVTWVPAEQGLVAIELRATNLAGSARQSVEVTVEGRSGPVFTTEPPTEAAVAAPYAYDPRVVAEGDISWSLPAAPEGLTIDESTGAVRWIPGGDQVGEHAVSIRASEVGSGRSADQEFTVTVLDTGGPAMITSTPPERVFAGEVWSYPATAAGAPTVEWSLVTPTTGTPAGDVQFVTNPPEGPEVALRWDTENVSPGRYAVALRVDNGLGQPDTQEFTVTVDPRPPVPEIDLVTVPPPETIFVGAPYVYDVELTPGTESDGVRFTLVGTPTPADLPITIESDTGLVRFTASTSNGELEYRYSVRAENILGEGDEETITVDAIHAPAPPLLTIVPATTFELEVGERFPGAAATATGNPTPTLTISGTLPDFLDFDPRTGLLSASAAKPAPENADIGAHAFDIVATSSEGLDRATVAITVVAAPPEVHSITPAAGRRQSDVPVVVRGAGFVPGATPLIRLELGAYSETLVTQVVDETTLSAVVPASLSRPPGVYDVIVDQGSTTTLAKRFTVTAGEGATWNGLIATDVTMSAAQSPHVVTGDLRIENGATVTLEPGAVVMFAGATNRRIDVGVAEAGALLADGGAPGVGDQIVLTRFQEVGGPPPSGHYRGLRFGANNVSAVTVLRNVVVEFGGRRGTATEQGAIEVLAGSAPRIEDSLIRESWNFGLYGQSGAGSDARSWFASNQLTSNARGPISMGSNDVSTLGPDLELAGNGVDRIYVRGSAVLRPNATWNDHGVPYFLSADLWVRGGSSLTLAPGTEMRFAESRRLRVSTGGTSGEQATLVASGTPQAPIRMLPDSGAWDGVHLDDNVRSGTALRNVRLEGFNEELGGGLRIDAVERVVIVESCFFQSDEINSVAVHVPAMGRVASFENNVLDAKKLSVDAAMLGFSDVLNASSIYETPLQVRRGTAASFDMVWSKPTASDAVTQPIRPTGNLTVRDGSLRIAAGNRIEMPLDGQLSFIDSQLVVDGASIDPVVFEPASGVPYWHGIRLRGAGVAPSRISNAVLDSGGSDPSLAPFTSRAAITLELQDGVPAIAAVSDTVILDSNGYGMTFANAAHCGGSCDDNTISGSRFSAVRIHANFVGRFGEGNALAGNNTSNTLGHEGVWVVGDVIDTTASWPANDVPYVVQGNIELRQSHPFDPIPVLTIEPGSELRFASGRRLRVGEGNEGILDARGTPGAPITMTSIDTATPVFWRGIDFNQGSDGSVLDHVVVSHGGLGDGTGNVNCRIGSVVRIDAAVLSHSAHYGAVVYSGSAPEFAGPAANRVYERNGQVSSPGLGDPAFDCVLDVGTGVCEPI